LTDREILELLVEKVSGLDTKVSDLDAKVSGLDRRMCNMEKQVKENTGLIKALIHAGESQKAEIEGLKMEIAKLTGTVNSIDKRLYRMAEDITFLVRKCAEHDEDIRELQKQVR